MAGNGKQKQKRDTASRTSDGRGHAWSLLRRAYQDQLERGQTFACWKCGRIITAGNRWCLGHKTPVIFGGTDDDVAPECRKCSDTEGGTLGHAQWRRNRARNSIGIDWFGATS